MPALRNARHERFAQGWLEGKTLTQAWENVSGKRSLGYASRLGKRPEVRARLQELRAEREAAQQKALAAAAARFQVTAERVIGELARIAFANLTDFVKIGPDGNPRPDFATLSFDQGAALQVLTVKEAKTRRKGESEVREVTFKLGDKRLALVALARHLRLFGTAGEIGEAGPAERKLDIVRERPLTMAEWEARLNARISEG